MPCIWHSPGGRLAPALHAAGEVGGEGHKIHEVDVAVFVEVGFGATIGKHVLNEGRVVGADVPGVEYAVGVGVLSRLQGETVPSARGDGGDEDLRSHVQKIAPPSRICLAGNQCRPRAEDCAAAGPGIEPRRSNDR